jgi:uncharacterized membrane protein HdeD (DUF308 family)
VSQIRFKLMMTVVPGDKGADAMIWFLLVSAMLSILAGIAIGAVAGTSAALAFLATISAVAALAGICCLFDPGPELP